MATTQPERILTLDIVRGVAVMGILAMNIIAFAMPEPAYSNPAAYGGSTGIDLLIWLFNFIFVDGKMRGLFSFLFGASMLLVIQRAEAKGESPARVHYRRMIWLLLFGLLHLYLIWWGDILQHYALIGMLAYLFRNKPVKSLLIWAGVLIAVEVVLMGLLGAGFVYMSHKAGLPGASAEAVERWGQMKTAFGPFPAAKLAKDLALYRGSYGGIVLDRLDDWAVPISTFFMFGAETLGYMLLGMAGLKSGFLTGEWSNARYRKWAAIGYLISVPIFALLAWVIVSNDFHPAVVAAASFGATTPIRPVMIVGLAALIILLTRSGGALVTRIAAAGRAAFTNYLGTSLIVSTIFYGYGAGLYGYLSRGECYLVVLAMWTLMLLWSKPWLDIYRYGPFEWLWRSLARGAFQPMRKSVPAEA